MLEMTLARIIDVRNFMRRDKEQKRIRNFV